MGTGRAGLRCGFSQYVLDMRYNSSVRPYIPFVTLKPVSPKAPKTPDATSRPHPCTAWSHDALPPPPADGCRNSVVVARPPSGWGRLAGRRRRTTGLPAADHGVRPSHYYLHDEGEGMAGMVIKARSAGPAPCGQPAPQRALSILSTAYRNTRRPCGPARDRPSPNSCPCTSAHP